MDKYHPDKAGRNSGSPTHESSPLPGALWLILSHKPEPLAGMPGTRLASLSDEPYSPEDYFESASKRLKCWKTR
jgi:hypothetical protein